MSMPRSTCPSWLINAYRLALFFYPKSFRENYRELMLQAFIDSYQQRHKSKPALFFFDTVNDLGASMSQEHFSDFSQRGRINMAMLGLLLALGLLLFRPFLTNTLSDGFVGIANFDQTIDMRLYSDHAEHRLEIAEDLLMSRNPISVIAGALSYSELRSDGNLRRQSTIDIKSRVDQALQSAANDSSIWLAVYPLCANDPGICNAETTLIHLQSIAPENGITWLYTAAAASENNDPAAQEAYLLKAENAAVYEDYGNAINASLHRAYASHPYQSPWYGFMAKEDHAFAEWFVWPIENYSIPGCREASKSSAAVKTHCGNIAMRIAAQSGSSLQRKLSSTRLAVKLGHAKLQSELDILNRQNKAYYEAIWTQNIATPAELAKAYGEGRQYDFAVQTIAKYHLLDKAN